MLLITIFSSLFHGFLCALSVTTLQVQGSLHGESQLPIQNNLSTESRRWQAGGKSEAYLSAKSVCNLNMQKLLL